MKKLLSNQAKSHKIIKVRRKSDTNLLYETRDSVKEYFQERPDSSVLSKLLKRSDTLAQTCFIGSKKIVGKVIQRKKEELLSYRYRKESDRDLSPEDKNVRSYYKKLRSVREGQAKEQKFRDKKLKSLRVSAQIQEQKQSNSLKSYRRMSQYWDKVTYNLSSKLNSEDLAFNRGAYHRNKREKIEMKPKQDTWLQSLRNNKNPNFLKLPSNDIHVTLLAENISNEVILSPNKSPSKKKNRRNTIEEKPRAEYIDVAGEGKLRLEMKAAQQVGLKHVRVDLLVL